MTHSRRTSLIAVDDTDAYWTNEGTDLRAGTLMKAPLSGGAPVTLATDQNFGRIAVDATSVYWTNPLDGKLMKVSRSGGALVTLASDQSGLNSITVDATRVYWSTYTSAGCPDNGGSCSPDGKLKSVPLDGGAPTTLVSGIENPGAIVVDGSSVYWTSPSINIMTGAVMKAPLGGGAPTTLASHRWGMGDSIAVNTTNVYWTQRSGGADGGTNDAVATVRISGGTATTLVTGSSIGLDIAIDDTTIYWLSSDTGGVSLKGMPIAGGDETTLASPVYGAQFNALAVGASSVYLASTAASGSILMLGAKTCESGMCKCAGTQVACFGACVDLESDAKHCGACNKVCDPGTRCTGGHCGN